MLQNVVFSCARLGIMLILVLTVVDPEEFLAYFENMSVSRGREAAEKLLAYVAKGVAKLKAEKDAREAAREEAAANEAAAAAEEGAGEEEED